MLKTVGNSNEVHDVLVVIHIGNESLLLFTSETVVKKFHFTKRGESKYAGR
jgi:hypothetical protein